jgi:hypothetical protein
MHIPVIHIYRYAAIFFATASAIAQQATPCAGLPPGKHNLLERMTAQFGLTCEQQLKIEPLLHDEESVTKPLLKFASLSQEEKQGIMLTIKLAARRQIRSELTAEQQKGMDQEVESVSKANAGGGKKAAKKADTPPSIDDEQVLSKAIVAYVALNLEEKKAMLLRVKLAARNDASLSLGPEQAKKLDAEIAELKK